MSESTLTFRLRPVRQQDSHGCGVACLAMVAGTEYNQARTTFELLDLAKRRKNRAPFTSNFRELRSALLVHGLKTRMERWPGWEGFTGIGILKVSRGGPTGQKDWHWVAAEDHPECRVVIRDPSFDFPSFFQPPLDTLLRPFEQIKPYGNWIRILQDNGSSLPSEIPSP